jgi:putative ATPase
MSDTRPLAERLRPGTLAEFIGQEHITAKLIQEGLPLTQMPSLIFWGPPGCGKTSLSRLLARELDLPYEEFSATVSGIAEVKKTLRDADAQFRQHGRPLILFIDEIHHFNKSAQDAFLPYVERGVILLLGTTTENPSFKINRALLSRIQVFEFRPLEESHLQQLYEKALAMLPEDKRPNLQPGARKICLDFANGDGRRLLNLLEALSSSKNRAFDEEGLKKFLEKPVMGYDRSGDDRYQLISALHKSIRNSDCDAALYWLARMLVGGEDPVYLLRRLIRITAEDIGLADPQALSLCLECKAAFEALGSPEGDIFLVMAVVYLASAPKSDSLYKAHKAAVKLAADRPLPVPLHILNADHGMAVAKGAGKSYLYAHDFPERTTPMNTLPVGMSEPQIYTPLDKGFEKNIAQRLEYWHKLKEQMRQNHP